ncbi:ubiquitin-like-specific protease esd4 isoform x1 [Hordeum vulgare]|nr:ubiquitin-like-specific protease esd4 isoform x1 [Hordeum vulgare]
MDVVWFCFLFKSPSSFVCKSSSTDIKVNRLKWKLSCAAARNVKFKRSSDFPSASTFTIYFGKLFSSCIASLSPRQVSVIQSYGADCLLKFVRFVYECLLTSIKKFKDSTKVASKRSVTFGGCHYAFAVSYLDNVHFGLNALPDIKPRILVWRGNKVKHFSDLDKCNSRSYGKRPLKRLSPSLYAPKSCEKFSCSRGRDAATSKIPFANNTTTSEVNAPAGSNVSFASKVESAYASCLGIEVVKQIIDLVQKSNADKPINFQDWSESLVLNVLGLIGDSKFKSPVRSCAEYPLGSKADSPTFKNSGSDDLPGSSPTTSLFAMPVAMPTSIPSGSPLKRCKPNVGLISNVRPSMHRFKSDCASKDDHCVKKVDQIFRSAGVDFEFHPHTRNHSPLLPVRLSQRFIDDVGSTEFSVHSPKTPFEQDGVLMVALTPSNNSNPVQSSNKNHVDLTSPEALNEFFNGRDDVVGIDDVQIVGTSIFSDRCVNFTKKTNEAYNQLNKLASSSSFSLGAVNNPEVLIISDPHCVAKLKAAHQHNISITSKVSDCSTSTIQDVPRRIVGAARFNSDPYVRYEAIRYDRAFCSYRSLASLYPNGHIDNFLLLCFCRYLFNKCHPSKSKKHFFFSYVGLSELVQESILNNNNPDTRNPAIVRNAFEGACSAYLLWRSNFLYFPIGLEKHWFSFVVCLRDKTFVFLDSAYGENSMYHKAIRNEMIYCNSTVILVFFFPPQVNNFTSLWHEFVTPMMNRRIAFESFDVLYPAVPTQDNCDDCGVFTFKFMEIFTPRTQMANLFSSADILNLRIRYANEMFFSPLNSCDKSFVTDFFLHEDNAN